MWDGSRWQEVTEILDVMQTPTDKRYHVVCLFKNEFWLVYDPDQDCWQVSAAGEAGNINQKESQ